MGDIVGKSSKTLRELGVASPSALAELFAALGGIFDSELGRADSPEAWQGLRDNWLGRKKGVLTRVKDNWLLKAAPELKPEVGKHLNALRAHVEQALAARQGQLEAAPVAGEAPDLTLPGLAARPGARHLITQTLEEICDIFARIGFSVVEGPEVETEYYNFEALNIPEFHPARDTMDTFYLDLPAAAVPAEIRGPHPDKRQALLLRTHTSPMQIRTMEKQKPPVRVVVPGKVYRRDNPDATHSFMFHQVEGLAVDRDFTFCEFKRSEERRVGKECRSRWSPYH